MIAPITWNSSSWNMRTRSHMDHIHIIGKTQEGNTTCLIRTFAPYTSMRINRSNGFIGKCDNCPIR